MEAKTKETANARGARPAVRRIRLELLYVDEGVQSRMGLDAGTVARYAELMEEGVEFPPVVAFTDGTRIWLADGFHRAAAAARAGLEELPAEIRQGTRRDAMLYSVGANTAHGLPRSREDKRRAVKMLLRDEEWVKWGDREIARQCGVTHTFVNKIRSGLLPATERAPSRLVRRSGTTYEMRDRRAPARADKPQERGPNYMADWLYYLVRFNPRQFLQWKGIVKERTSTTVLAEAVDVVMRGLAEE